MQDLSSTNVLIFNGHSLPAVSVSASWVVMK